MARNRDELLEGDLTSYLMHCGATPAAAVAAGRELADYVRRYAEEHFGEASRPV
ncbi:hypothetical protein [Gordonia rubripertincta]|uniref:hypothetical protein n=1 Tax=Gordonia rubripertincta TaxID=36822 RepID=UPI0015FC2DED|nr:hypothetical protein [Gordonia rubripertincta]QMU22485.1 hypothetical protein H3V45_08470 [Gordonia rubripertincta]